MFDRAIKVCACLELFLSTLAVFSLMTGFVRVLGRVLIGVLELIRGFLQLTVPERLTSNNSRNEGSLAATFLASSYAYHLSVSACFMARMV